VELRDFPPAYSKIQGDLERLSRTVTPSYVSITQQMDRALKPVYTQHLEMARAVERAGSTMSLVGKIVDANMKAQRLIDNVSVSTKLLQDMSGIHRTWSDKFSGLQRDAEGLQAATKLSMSNVAYQLTVTERVYFKIDFEAMARGFSVPSAAIMKLENAIDGLASQYAKLTASIQTPPDLMRLPSTAILGATRELYIAGHAMETICIPGKPSTVIDECDTLLAAETEQATSVCASLLKDVDPALVKPYLGARDAMQSKSVDRARHVLASLRELWSHLLRTLAPDKDVLGWMPSDHDEMLHEGKPTRRTRVLYICRMIDHPPLIEFTVQDTTALVKFIDFFSRVHILDLGLTDEQLHALILRTESWIVYLLQIR
jgi:hypothetical protein